VDIIERDGDWVQAHRVHNWCYLGSHTRQGQPPDTPLATAAPAEAGHASTSAATSARFDLDTYKILVKPLISGSADVQALG
jgi:hypothetical protein